MQNQNIIYSILQFLTESHPEAAKETRKLALKLSMDLNQIPKETLKLVDIFGTNSIEDLNLSTDSEHDSVLDVITLARETSGKIVASKMLKVGSDELKPEVAMGNSSFSSSESDSSSDSDSSSSSSSSDEKVVSMAKVVKERVMVTSEHDSVLDVVTLARETSAKIVASKKLKVGSDELKPEVAMGNSFSSASDSDSDSSSSSSDSDSSSSSSSSDENVTPETIKPASVVIVSESLTSDSSSSSSSSSDEEITIAPANITASSASSSSSSTSSKSSSSAASSTTSLKKKVLKKTISTPLASKKSVAKKDKVSITVETPAASESDSSSNSSSSSSSSGSSSSSSGSSSSDASSSSTASSEKVIMEATITPVASKKRALESVPTPSSTVSTEEPQRKKTKNEIAIENRFQRIKVEEVVFQAEELKDNTFMNKGGSVGSYGHRAHEDLIVTRGKGFRKEKDKKKRGSYRGGAIDFQSHSIKYPDSD